MEWQPILTALLSVGLFSAFIHAIVEVVKGVLLNPLRWGREIFLTIFRGDVMSEETIKSIVFILAFVYCKVFDFDAMTDILQVKIPDDAMFKWTMAYFGTASVVYVGVDVFYNSIEKVKSMLTNAALSPKEKKDA